MKKCQLAGTSLTRGAQTVLPANKDPLRGEGVSDAGEALGEWSMDYDQRVTGLIQRVHPGIEFMKETMIFIGFEIMIFIGFD